MRKIDKLNFFPSVSLYDLLCATFDLVTLSAISTPGFYFGLYCLFALPYSKNLLVGGLFVFGSQLWRNALNEERDLAVFRKFVIGWHRKFLPKAYSVFSTLSMFKTNISDFSPNNRFAPDILHSELSTDAKWPSAWMTYQFLNRKSLICVDTKTSDMTDIQRLIILHEMGHSLITHRFFAMLVHETSPFVIYFLTYICLLNVNFHSYFYINIATFLIICIGLQRILLFEFEDRSEILADRYVVERALEMQRDFERETLILRYIRSVVPTQHRANMLETVDLAMGRNVSHQVKVVDTIDTDWTLAERLPAYYSVMLWLSVLAMFQRYEMDRSVNTVSIVLLNTVLPLFYWLYFRFKIASEARSVGLKYRNGWVCVK